MSRKIAPTNSRRPSKGKVARPLSSKGATVRKAKLAKRPEGGVHSVRAAAAAPQPSPADVLAKAEVDISAAIDSLNRQMSTALNAITELAVAQRGRGEAVVRTAPLDRATATFQRLVADVVDEKLAELAPPLISLRSEMAQHACADGQSESGVREFCQRGVEVLDQVLSVADIRMYEAPVGSAFDSLIHLAVGEVHRGDLPDGAVAECIQPGFRTARGKVIAPARVKVNRR